MNKTTNVFFNSTSTTLNTFYGYEVKRYSIETMKHFTFGVLNFEIINTPTLNVQTVCGDSVSHWVSAAMAKCLLRVTENLCYTA